jgi:hypothetical protein
MLQSVIHTLTRRRTQGCSQSPGASVTPGPPTVGAEFTRTLLVGWLVERSDLPDGRRCRR